MKNQILWMCVMAIGMGYNTVTAVQEAQQKNWKWMGVSLVLALSCAVLVVIYSRGLYKQLKQEKAGSE